MQKNDQVRLRHMLDAARRIMENDPAVKGGIMTAKQFPFRVVLKG